MVKKVFTLLGTAVACIIAIAIVINVLMPNAIAGISNNVELAIKQATGAQVDFNGDGVGGTGDNKFSHGQDQDQVDADGLDGFNNTIEGN